MITKLNRIGTIAAITGICAIGSTLLSVALASKIFEATGSSTQSALVFLIQSLPITIFLRFAWHLSEQNPPMRLIYGACLVSAIVSIAIGFTFENSFQIFFYGLLALRGFLESLIKQGRAVAIKALSSSNDTGRNSTTITLFEFVGQALGAIFAVYALQYCSIMEICLLDMAFFLIGMVLAYLIPRFDLAVEDTTAPKTLAEVIKQIRTYPNLIFYLSVVVSVVITMQAMNQTLRTWLPISWLGMQARFVGFTETIGLLGIVTGIFFVKKLLDKDQSNARTLGHYATAASVLLVLLFTSKSIPIVLGLYFLYMLVFEISFAYAMSSMLIKCPSHLTKSVVALFYAMAYGGVSLFGLIIAISSDHFGLKMVAIYIALFFIILLKCHQFILNKSNNYTQIKELT